MGPRARKRRSTVQGEMFLRIRDQFVVVGLRGVSGAVKYKLPLTKEAIEKNSVLRKKSSRPRGAKRGLRSRNCEN